MWPELRGLSRLMGVPQLPSQDDEPCPPLPGCPPSCSPDPGLPDTRAPATLASDRAPLRAPPLPPSPHLTPCLSPGPGFQGQPAALSPDWVGPASEPGGGPGWGAGWQDRWRNQGTNAAGWQPRGQVGEGWAGCLGGETGRGRTGVPGGSPTLGKALMCSVGLPSPGPFRGGQGGQSRSRGGDAQGGGGSRTGTFCWACADKQKEQGQVRTLAPRYWGAIEGCCARAGLRPEAGRPARGTSRT